MPSQADVQYERHAGSVITTSPSACAVLLCASLHVTFHSTVQAAGGHPQLLRRRTQTQASLNDLAAHQDAHFHLLPACEIWLWGSGVLPTLVFAAMRTFCARHELGMRTAARRPRIHCTPETKLTLEFPVRQLDWQVTLQSHRASSSK